MSRVLLVLPMAFSLACSDGGGDAPPALDSVSAAWLQASCERVFRCPRADDHAAYLQDSATCVAVLAQRPTLARDLGLALDPRILQRVREGRLRFDAAAARACLARAAADCAAPSCRSLFVGAVASGGACGGDDECVRGTFCEQAETVPAPCEGTCRPQRPVGAACHQTRQCLGWEANLADCTSAVIMSPQEGQCVAITRGPPAPEGEACGRLGARDIECAAGLVCSTRCARPRTPIARGAPCRRGEQCQAGDVCARDRCTAASEAVQSVAGAPCSAGGVPCNALRGLACGPSGSCAPIGDGSAGAPCLPTLDNRDLFREGTCAPTLRCDPETRRCAARLPVGMPCARHADCASLRCVEMACAPADAPSCPADAGAPDATPADA